MIAIYQLAAEGPNGRHIPADPNEVYWGSLAFFVVIGLAIWKVGPVAAQALRDRTARIEAELASAKAARAEAEAALEANASHTVDVSAEEAKIMAEAEMTATRLKADLINKAEADAAALVERGRADVEARRRQARADLTAEVGEMTRTTAEAVVRGRLDDGAQTDLIENYINQVSGMS
jgi:F-type H+-transporting ATPase subunit b